MDILGKRFCSSQHKEELDKNSPADQQAVMPDGTLPISNPWTGTGLLGKDDQTQVISKEPCLQSQVTGAESLAKSAAWLVPCFLY